MEAPSKYDSNFSRWWLRSAVSDDSSRFMIIDYDGNYITNAGVSNYEYGVSPAFRLG